MTDFLQERISMPWMLRVSVVFCVVLLTASLPFAHAGPERQQVELEGPNVLKMNWKTRALRMGDLNMDGRPDMTVINNSHARIDLLLHQEAGDKEQESSGKTYRTTMRWEPTLSDAPFEKQHLVTGIRMFDLVIGDLNGDERADLAYTGQPDDLTVRYQKQNGTYTDKKVYEFPTSVSTKTDTLAVADVNENGRNNLVVMGKKQLFVYTRNNGSSLERAGEYGLVEANSNGLQAMDLNRDDRLDLVYTAPSNQRPLRMRPGLETGGFGPERMFDIQPPKQFPKPISLPEVEGPMLAYLQDETEMLTLLRFVQAKADENREQFSLKDVSPHVYSTGHDITDARYTIGDLDGNGRADIVAADPGSAQFLVYFQSGDGVLSEPKSFPGPNDVRSIAAVDINRDDTDELFMVSREEEQLGVSRWDPAGRMSYPQSVPIQGQPLATSALELAGTPSIAVAHAHEGERMVSILQRKGEGDTDWKTTQTLKLSELNVNPTDLRSMDATGNGTEDLAVFAPGSAVLFFVQNDGDLRHASKANGTSGNLRGTDPSALHHGDLDGDEIDELFLAENSYLRSIRLQDNGRMKVLDQYNARSSDARITAGMVMDVDRDGVNDLLMLDERNGTLQLLKKNDTGVYRFVEAVKLGNIDQVRTDVIDFDRDGTRELFVFGARQFWKIPVRPSPFRHEIYSTWKMDMEDVTPSRVATGDLNDDGRDELIAADTTDSRMLGVYAQSDQDKWDLSLSFKVFSSDPHYKGNTGSESEPKEMHVADVTGDGKEDLLLLVHNRILVYPQKTDGDR